MLDTYVPAIIEGFVSTRFDSLQVRLGFLGWNLLVLFRSVVCHDHHPFHLYLLQSEFTDELSENPLDNVELLQDHLDFFPYLCRFQVKT